MIPVIVISHESRPAVLEPLITALGGRARVTLDVSGELCAGGGDYLICVRKRMPRLDGRGVVVLCSWQGGRLNIPGHVRAAALSGDRHARRVLRQSRCEALCCGMSYTDSLTLSSLLEDSAVLSLQRELTDLRGDTLEPCDLPVVLDKPYESGELLLASAAALICGELPVRM